VYSKLPNYTIIARINPEKRVSKPKAVPRRIGRRLSRAVIAQLVAAYQAGATARQLTDRYSISKTSVQELLHEHGVVVRRLGISDTEITEAVQHYGAGKSVAQVARAVNLSTSSVYDALKRAGVQMRKAHEKGRR
jgi:transposase